MYKLSLERSGRYNVGLGYTFSSADSSLLSGLEHYWTLNEASGARNDSVGTAHLTDNNTVGYAVGMNGNAASFLTANLEYLSYTNYTPASDEFTVSYWVYPTVNTQSGHVTVATAWSAAVWFGVYQTVAGANINITGAVSNGSGAVTAPTGVWSVGSWYHVVLTYTAADKKCRISVNNAAQVASSALSGTHYVNSGQAINIGRLANAGSYHAGQIDEVGIWSRVLTADERTTLYNAGAGKFYPEF